MKKSILFIACICCLAACKKTGSSPQGGIFGKWELRKSYGGFGYKDSTYLAGNGTIYQFQADSTYQYYIKNQLTEQGTFHTRTIHIDPSGLPSYEILFSNGTGQQFGLNGNQLTLGTTVTDGIAKDYLKISAP